MSLYASCVLFYIYIRAYCTTTAHTQINCAGATAVGRHQTMGIIHQMSLGGIHEKCDPFSACVGRRDDGLSECKGKWVRSKQRSRRRHRRFFYNRINIKIKKPISMHYIVHKSVLTQKQDPKRTGPRIEKRKHYIRFPFYVRVDLFYNRQTRFVSVDFIWPIHFSLY